MSKINKTMLDSFKGKYCYYENDTFFIGFKLKDVQGCEDRTALDCIVEELVTKVDGEDELKFYQKNFHNQHHIYINFGLCAKLSEISKNDFDRLLKPKAKDIMTKCIIKNKGKEIFSLTKPEVLAKSYLGDKEIKKLANKY